MKLLRAQLVFAAGISAALAAVVACSSDSTDPSPLTTPDRSGADGGVSETGDAGDSGTRDAGASTIWPNDATKLVAKNAGGGLIAPSPDAGCTIGAATYTLTVSSRLLESTRCVRSDAGVYGPVNGSKSLTATELASVVTTLQAVKPAADPTACGADKPLLTMTVTDPRGEHLYTDSFYACRKDTGATYVDDIDPVFTKLSALAVDMTL